MTKIVKHGAAYCSMFLLENISLLTGLLLFMVDVFMDIIGEERICKKLILFGWKTWKFGFRCLT